MEATESEAEKPSAVVARVQQFFDHYGLNASSASRTLGYGTTSKLYKILQGSEPSFPTLVDFLEKWPDLSADWLVLGRGPMLRSGATDAAPKAKPTQALATANSWVPVNSGQVLAITVGLDGKENTALVPVVAQAGYTRQHNEAVYIEQLKQYRIPGFEQGTFRAFEVAGDSMEPTFNHRDIVVASAVADWRLLVPGDVYVVVTPESVLLKRIYHRITDLAKEVMLYSDNRMRAPYPLDGTDIIELWRVRGYISSYIPSAPAVTVERLLEIIESFGFDPLEVKRYLEESVPHNTSHQVV